MLQSEDRSEPAEEQTRVPVPPWMKHFAEVYSPTCSPVFSQRSSRHQRALGIKAGEGRLTYWKLVKNLAAALFPLLLTASTLGFSGGMSSFTQQAAATEAPEGLEELGGRSRGCRASAAGGPATSFYVWFGLAAAMPSSRCCATTQHERRNGCRW